MSLVYISSPYSNGDKEQNVLDALLVADKVLELGHTPFVPHLSHYWDLISPKSWDVWMKIDLEMLHRCDVVLRLREGISRGADIECQKAEEWGIPVYYKLEDLGGENV